MKKRLIVVFLIVGIFSVFLTSCTGSQNKSAKNSFTGWFDYSSDSYLFSSYTGDGIGVADLYNVYGGIYGMIDQEACTYEAHTTASNNHYNGVVTTYRGNLSFRAHKDATYIICTGRQYYS